MSQKIAKTIVENLLVQHNKSLEYIRAENNELTNDKPLDYKIRIYFNIGKIEQYLIMINDLKLILKELNEG